MLNNALQFTGEILDQYLKNRFGADESKVLLNTLIESNGSVPAENQNKVVISLINIEKETHKQLYGRNKKLENGNYANVSPFERYNIDLLISSHFDDYIETLKFLNGAMLFFQVNNCIHSSSFSTIPVGVKKLEFDLEQINYVQMQGLWTSMGAKYVPSVIYKMRLLTVQGHEVRAFVPAISQISNTVTV